MYTSESGAPKCQGRLARKPWFVKKTSESFRGQRCGFLPCEGEVAFAPANDGGVITLYD